MKTMLLVSSSGSHLLQLKNLAKHFREYDQLWITRNDDFSRSLLKNDNAISAFFPEHRNIISFFKNFVLAIKIFTLKKPKLLVSTGAGVAVPFFLVAKVFSIPSAYIDVFVLIDKPSLSGKIICHLADIFFVQNKKLTKHFPEAIYKGSLL